MKLQKYDIVLINDIICCYIGKYHGISCFETIIRCSDNYLYKGIELSYFPKYDAVVHRFYWGYTGIEKVVTLINKQNKIKPTLEEIKDIAKQFKNDARIMNEHKIYNILTQLVYDLNGVSNEQIRELEIILPIHLKHKLDSEIYNIHLCNNTLSMKDTFNIINVIGCKIIINYK